MDVTKLIRISVATVLGTGVSFVAGCAPEVWEEDEEDLDQAKQAVLSNNALSNNALSNNALSNNALSNNALSNNALSNNALSNNGLGVQLIKYIIRCALPSSACLDVTTTATDTNVPSECVGGSCHFCGNLNLAPGWQTQGLSLSQEKWMSACLLSHINIDGTSVPISVRDAVSGNIATVTSSEYALYNAPEAAFYGNLFRPGPNGEVEKYVCNAGSSLTPPGRVCGLSLAGAVECSMTFTGSCVGHEIGQQSPNGTHACDYEGALPNGAVRQCHSTAATTWNEVLTIYDQQYCGDGMCSGSETNESCAADCQLKHHDD